MTYYNKINDDDDDDEITAIFSVSHLADGSLPLSKLPAGGDTCVVFLICLRYPRNFL